MLMLAAANRDPDAVNEPNTFNPLRKPSTHFALGAGIHFCVGAPLARLELQKSLPVLFNCFPKLELKETPIYANLYHFHGLKSLKVNI